MWFPLFSTSYLSNKIYHNRHFGSLPKSRILRSQRGKTDFNDFSFIFICFLLSRFLWIFAGGIRDRSIFFSRANIQMMMMGLLGAARYEASAANRELRSVQPLSDALCVFAFSRFLFQLLRLFRTVYVYVFGPIATFWQQIYYTWAEVNTKKRFAVALCTFRRMDICQTNGTHNDEWVSFGYLWIRHQMCLCWCDTFVVPFCVFFYAWLTRLSLERLLKQHRLIDVVKLILVSRSKVLKMIFGPFTRKFILIANLAKQITANSSWYIAIALNMILLFIKHK